MDKKLEIVHEMDENTVLSDEVDLGEWEHALKVKHKLNENMNMEISRKEGNTTAKVTMKI